MKRCTNIKRCLGLCLTMALMTVGTAHSEQITPEQMAEIERRLAEDGVEHPIMKRQNEFGEIVERVSAKYPDILISSEVGDICKIYLKGEAPEEIRDWVNASDLVIRIVDKLPFSLMELENKSDEAAAILEKAGYSVQASSVDAPHDIWIQVGLKEGQPSAEKDILKLLPKDLAKLVRIETIGGKNDPPGMTGYVVAIGKGGDSFLLTSHEPDKGRLACNNAIWFSDPDCGLQVGQQVQVWFSHVMKSYPGQSSAIRTKLVEDEPVGKSAAIQLAMKKRQEDAPPGIPFVVSIERDHAGKQWKVLFASDTNEGKVDAKSILVADGELTKFGK